MKNYKYFYIICLFLVFTSCSDYLDQVPDEKLTEENLFKSKDDVVKVLTQIYSTYNNPIDFRYYVGNAGDDVDFNWSGYNPYYKDLGSFGPANGIYENNWWDIYKAVRTSNYFINRIDECKDEKLTEQERGWWKGEAYFLQAYYYFLLLQQFGPVPIIDKVYSGNELTATMQKGVARSSFDENVNYIDGLLVKAASLLDVTYSIPDRCGRANASAALFLRSRLWLYAASPLYNGMVNPTTGKNYSSSLMVKDNKGKELLNKTFSVDKWKKAMTYAEDAITLANKGGYNIYMGDGGNYSPGITAYKRIFSYPRGGEPSIETVFYNQSFGSNEIGAKHALPISWSGYTGVCPTMEHVNEYFMANGLLPEDDNNYQNASGFYSYNNDGFDIKLYNRFRERDPRFYANILFPGQYSYAMKTGSDESFTSKWAGDGNNNIIYFRPFVDGQDGFNNKTGRDYCNTGFLCIKWVPTSITKSNYGDYAVPVFRYTELLLNLMEAAFEYDVAAGINPLEDQHIFESWNKIRDRVGLSHVKDAYAAAGIPLTTAKLRELIHRERRIELAFEGHRYFDNRRWLDAEREGGTKHGFDIMKKADEGFWSEVTFETRFWNNKMYFLPLPQVELDRNPALTQNPGW